MTRLRARIIKPIRLQRNRRGLTLIEMLVALIVIATASVGTTIAFYTAYGSLQEQRHRMRANDLLRREIEVWQGRIHASGKIFPTTYEQQQPTDWEEVLLDGRGPGHEDDIYAEIRRESLEIINLRDTPQDPDYCVVNTVIRWWEPSRIPGEPPVQIEQSLYAFMLPSVPPSTGGSD